MCVHYLLCNDEHSDQEEGDINAAHHLWMLDQPYGPQDGCILSPVTSHSQKHSGQNEQHVSLSSAADVVMVMPPPPAAVPGGRIGSENDFCVGHEEHAPGAEDDGVEGCRGQGEEEHFEFKAHPEKHPTRQQ